MADPCSEPTRTPTSTSTKPANSAPTSSPADDLERIDCSPTCALGGDYWSLRWDLPPRRRTSARRRRTPPATSASTRPPARRGRHDPVVVTGVVTKRFDVTIRDEGWVYAAKFCPGGLAGLTGVDARDCATPLTGQRDVLDLATADALRELGPILVRRGQTRLRRSAGSPGDDPDRRYLLLLDVIAAMLDDRSLLKVAQVEEKRGVRPAPPRSSSATSASAPMGLLLPHARRGHRPIRRLRRLLAHLASSTAGSTSPTSPASSPTSSAYHRAPTSARRPTPDGVRHSCRAGGKCDQLGSAD